MFNYDIATKRLRYIVPFEYNPKKERFEEIIKKVDEYIDYPYSFMGNINKNIEARWKRSSLRHLNQDVYGYIIDEFVLEGDIDYKDEVNKMGIYWNYDLFKKDPFVVYFDKEVPIEINDMGLYIFRSGVGFLWYEIKTDHFNTSIDLIRFQNIFKQLDRSYDHHISFKKDKFIGLDNIEDNDIPIILGSYFAERLAFLNIKFQAERKNVYSDLLKDIYPSMTIEEINNLLPEYCPDKSILFSYVVYKRDEAWQKNDETLKTAYYTTNGYRESYEMSDIIKDSVANPFSNVYWIASKEGCGYFAWERNDNSDFFENNQYYKVMDDYFILYLRALFQSFSLMKYSVYTSKILTSNYDDYLTVSDKTEIHYDEISSIGAEINLFIVKSLVTSVSHIQHQNEFYAYVVDRIKVNEDVNSVTAGLNVLNDMQNDTLNKKQRLVADEAERREKDADNSFQIGLGLVTFLAVISAFADSYSFMEGLAKNELSGLTQIFFIILCIICFMILFISLWLFIRTVKQFKNK